MRRVLRLAVALSFLAAVATAAYFHGFDDGRLDKDAEPFARVAWASVSVEEPSPVRALTDRDVYYPGTEDLGPDEMRVTACGTGMPNARPKQAAACWLVELGNGDKFLFDIGTGSAERISALKIPYNYIDKVFIGHLHSDHFGDLDALWIGGVVSNRVVPLRVWGPSSIEPKYGTKVALEHLEKSLAWDVDSRMGNTDTRGLFMEVTEFDYTKVNQVIYEENGVTIRTIPAIHIFDGPVSFILEWNGLKFAYSSDTFPNKWWMQHAVAQTLPSTSASSRPNRSSRSRTSRPRRRST